MNHGKHCTNDKKKPVHILSHLFGLCFHQASDDLFQTDWWFFTTIFHFVLSSKRHDYRLNCLHNRINNSVNKSNKCSIKKSYRITLSLYLFIQQNCKLFSMLKNIKIEKWSLFVHTQIVSRYVWPKRTICAIVAAAISNSIIHIWSYLLSIEKPDHYTHIWCWCAHTPNSLYWGPAELRRREFTQNQKIERSINSVINTQANKPSITPPLYAMGKNLRSNTRDEYVAGRQRKRRKTTDTE